MIIGLKEIHRRRSLGAKFNLRDRTNAFYVLRSGFDDI